MAIKAWLINLHFNHLIHFIMKKSHLMAIGLLVVGLMFSACDKDKTDYRKSVDFFKQFLPGTSWQLQSTYKVYRTDIENPIEEEYFQDCSKYDKLTFDNDTLLTVSNPFCTGTWADWGHDDWDGFGLGGLGTYNYSYRSDLVIRHVTNTAAILWFSPRANSIRSHYLYCPNDTTLVLWTAGYAQTIAAPESSGKASKFRLIH